jgi:TPR repeat protein
LLRRAQAGDVAAYDLLADSYLNAEGDQRDVEAAVRWLNAGVKAGDTDCMIALGNLYFAGQDLDQDEAKALSLYKAAAAKGDALGAYNAGLVYETSADDLTQALGWYWRAAAGGDEGGMYKLALAYQLGRGVAADEAQAVSWMRKAAAAGSVDATNDLGSYYLQGYGMPVDETRALDALRGRGPARLGGGPGQCGRRLSERRGRRRRSGKGPALLRPVGRRGQPDGLLRPGPDVRGRRRREGQPRQGGPAVSHGRRSDDAEVAQAASDAVERLESGSSETPIA